MEISTPDGARLLNPSLAQLKLLDLLSNEFGSPCASEGLLSAASGQKVSLKVDEFINVHLWALRASPPHHCTRLSFTRQELQRP